MPTRRITVEEVLEAYRVTGMKPTTNAYDTIRDGQSCGCAIGALAKADSPLDSARAWANHRYGSLYRWGFEVGFDDRDRSQADEICDRDKREVFNNGYADGTAVRQAVFQEQGAA